MSLGGRWTPDTAAFNYMMDNFAMNMDDWAANGFPEHARQDNKASRCGPGHPLLWRQQQPNGFLSSRGNFLLSLNVHFSIETILDQPSAQMKRVVLERYSRLGVGTVTTRRVILLKLNCVVTRLIFFFSGWGTREDHSCLGTGLDCWSVGVLGKKDRIVTRSHWTVEPDWMRNWSWAS